jgi:hypothetical protein
VCAVKENGENNNLTCAERTVAGVGFAGSFFLSVGKICLKRY